LPTGRWNLFARAVLIGALVAVVFVGFEWVVNHGTVFVWDDVFGTDDVRWRVVPLAIGASILFSLLLRALGQPRVGVVHTDPLAGGEDPPPATLSSIVVVLVVGAASLLAGASLGPEAALVAASAAIGAWVAGSGNRKVLTLAAVGALLIVFLGSLVPLLLPPLIMYRQQKRLVPAALLAVVLAGLTAYGVLYLIKGHTEGYGSIPAGTHFDVGDGIAAFILGIGGAVVGRLLKWSVKDASARTARIDARWPWLVSAMLFGAVIGVLYLIGGESVQFSGSEGSQMLVADHAGDTALALAGLLVVKLLVTGWSLAAGYRGGLVFPSIYGGVALSLFVASIDSNLNGTGAAIGTIAGLLGAMTGPVPGLIMLVSLLPFKLIWLALLGMAGAFVAGRVAKLRT